MIDVLAFWICALAWFSTPCALRCPACFYSTAVGSGSIAYLYSKGGGQTLASIMVGVVLVGASPWFSSRITRTPLLAPVSAYAALSTMMLATLLLFGGSGPGAGIPALIATLSIGSVLPAYVWLAKMVGRTGDCSSPLHLVSAGGCTAFSWIAAGQNSMMPQIMVLAGIGLIAAHLSLFFFGKSATLAASALTGMSACGLTAVAVYQGLSGPLVLTGVALAVATATTYDRAMGAKPPSDRT